MKRDDFTKKTKDIVAKRAACVVYNIYLGMDLMREMLPNYKNSLHRKRKHFER